MVLDSGIRVIEVDKIVGTVGKCGQLDRRFLPLKRKDIGERKRLYNLFVQMKQETFFPLIDVYRFNNRYYVIDGNRRVAIAKKLGMKYVDAHVKEYIYKDDEGSVKGFLSRKKFETLTSLKNINLEYEAGYSVLLKEVENYPINREIIPPIAEKARAWYSEFYIPAVSLVKRYGLQRRFDEKSEDDIIVSMICFYRDKIGGVPYTLDVETIVKTFIEVSRSKKTFSLKRVFAGFLYFLLARGIKRD